VPLPAIKRNPLADQVAERLFAEVTAGTWSVGQRLPSETTLAAQYGVGRSTIREAIRSLVGSGMLEARQGAGVFVRAPRAVENLEQKLRRAGILEVYEVRSCLEAAAARLAAERRTPEDLKLIEAALKRRSEARARSAEELVDADLEFHRSVVAAAWNSVLSSLYVALLPLLRERLVDVADDDEINSDDRPDRAADAHVLLLDALRRGAPDDAEAAVHGYLEQARATLDAAVHKH
jgi:GntR family transcriptional regulator, transcriptional repressor for pyruvate dehydrogenase complex